VPYVPRRLPRACIMRRRGSAFVSTGLLAALTPTDACDARQPSAGTWHASWRAWKGKSHGRDACFFLQCLGVFRRFPIGSWRYGAARTPGAGGLVMQAGQGDAASLSVTYRS